MRIASWNVNGLRSISTKGFDAWFGDYVPDVIALQEIKSMTGSPFSRQFQALEAT